MKKRSTKLDNWQRIKLGTTKTVGAIVFLELFGITASYLFYRRLNHDPEFRYELYKSKFSPIVETYYQVGEKMNSDCQIRKIDQENWRNQGKEL